MKILFSLPIFFYKLGLDTLHLGLGKNGKQLPAEVKALLDTAVLGDVMSALENEIAQFGFDAVFDEFSSSELEASIEEKRNELCIMLAIIQVGPRNL